MANVFNIPPDVPFLPALARAILAGGWPHEGIAPPGPNELPRWTVLLPTRRAARALQEELLKASVREFLLMPAIRPIGDLDEEDFAFEDAEIPEAVAPLGREYLLIELVNQWAAENPGQPLAAEIRASPAHTLSLAQSLARFVDAVEIEEPPPRVIETMFGQELALHREAILGFLDLVRKRLPQQLGRLQLLGGLDRRNRLIRLAADRLEQSPPQWPVIAAGSTGTIQATAHLIGVIARFDNSAVVLPGLDGELDDANWNEVSETHPQFGMKKLIERLEIERGAVRPLPGIAQRNPARTWLAREVMRPKQLTGDWHGVIEANRERIARGAKGVRAIAARNRAEEADAIALILRETLETPGRTAALVTPDRQLATRVRASLTRWGIIADDTAGEPLIATAAGSFLAALLDAVCASYAAVPLVALLRHRLLRDEADIASRFELVALRGRGLTTKRSFAALLADARYEIEADEHRHPALARIGTDDWISIATFAGSLDRALRPLLAHAQDETPKLLADHLEAVMTAANHLSDAFTQAKDDAARAVIDMLAEMRRQSGHHPPGRFDAAVATLRDQLRRRVVRSSVGTHPRLIVYGLLEARLMHADTVILGGLNEGKWPEQPETGPWLNRPMRRTLDLVAPEREIGLTAHDFVQAFGNANVVLTWSARLGGQPALPSRWILRLKLLLEAVGKWQELHAEPWLAWAQALDNRGIKSNPIRKPRPRPPLEARPKRLSISRVSEFLRDPYATYARQVLLLEPLEELGSTPDARLRGELIHEVLELYHRRYPGAPPDDIEKTLHELGAQVFAPYRDEPEVAALWLPRFARIAKWFAEKDAELRQGARRVVAECTASYEFSIAGEPFKLTGRADRIDFLADGTARILDFKTGAAPGVREVEIGLAPQLTLEAALLARGRFVLGSEKLAAMKTSHIGYLRLTGGEPAGEEANRGKGADEVMAMAEDHLAKLKAYLESFADPGTAYLPRYMLRNEDDASPFDHLSRYEEWILAEPRA